MHIGSFVAEYQRFHGGQKSLLALLQALQKEGVTVTVIFPGKGRCVEAFQEGGIPIHILPASGIFQTFGQHLFEAPWTKKIKIFLQEILPYSLRLYRFARAQGMDLIHVNTTRSLFLSGWVPWWFKFPILWHVRGSLALFPFWQRWLASAMASGILLVAKALVQDIPAPFRYKTQILYNPMPFPSFQNNTSKDPYHLLMVGAIVPAKGHHHLFQAVAKILKKEALPLKVTVLGETQHPDYFDYLKQILEKEGIKDRINFLGWQDDPFPYYAKASLLVLPSVEEEILQMKAHKLHIRGNEGIPRCILEAVAMELPVLATRVAGTEEVLGEGRGILVSPGDPLALSEGLKYFFSLSEEKKQSMARLAKAHLIRYFHPQVVAPKALKALQKVCWH